MTTLGRRWFAAFCVYVQHDFIASVITLFITTPPRLLRQPWTAAAPSLFAALRLATVVESFSARLFSDMA
jgi:hypothetical protein